ncbi:hypothetical protein KRP22_008714 [Phytophthora ramorum]|uniref:uncharacterized protein n=1 Tax=Phytophthora ramorum TaxID=164328 RepID=UPI0030B23FD8|nr:hypothetical protein KRP23_2595 [Phytophthora ramorum]KAH7502072.1 hypothetical protein KRP22_7546 [Phytophthora ramorum]
MSLGFLTESALVPSKGKTINVDAKSLVDLKALVSQKDQERKRRLQEALTAENDDGSSRLGKYAHLRGGNKRRKSSDEDKRHRNRGVEVRRRRDEEVKQQEAPDEDDDEAWSRKSAMMLRKKAKLYEEMVNGGGNDSLKGECLVDFEAKKFMTQDRSRKATSVEITDEFGRSRQVAPDSEEYAAFVQTQQQNDEVKREEVRDQEDKAGGGSFVISQWEKRLKTAEKKHLTEVHERATLARSLAPAASAGAIDKKSRKQQRLERLRKQRDGAAASGDGGVKNESTDAAVDSAASKKATDFLNQLSSLI